MVYEVTRLIYCNILNYVYLLIMEDKHTIHSAERWGLNKETIRDLGQQLYDFWTCFRWCFTTQRHDTSEHGLTYLKGLFLLPNHRNYKEIARKIEGPTSDGQNLQQFMSDSPWSALTLFDQLQHEIADDEHLQNGMLTLDESGNLCFGPHKAGAGHQYLGNVGKVDQGQVGVALGYYKSCLPAPSTIGVWAMVDAELFLPEHWFDDAHKAQFKRHHIPSDRVFKTKLEIGLELVDRAIANKLPFSRFGCDAFYGRDHDFRAAINDRNIRYIADVPANTRVYLEKPETGIPAKKGDGRGPQPTRWKVLNHVKPVQVCQVIKHMSLPLENVDIRACERGRLTYACAKQTVWTITSDGTVQCEQLLMRKEAGGKMSYSLSNADESISLQTLAQWRSERYFVERVFEDSKGEIGWDELQAIKYRAWMHHTAITALALWFVAKTRLKWAQQHPKDETLATELGLDKLPALSTANIRFLLQVVMPLRQFTLEEAIELLADFFVTRAKSTASRLEKAPKKGKQQKPG